MKISNYQESVEALYPFLEEYLQQQNIDTTKNFTCINPAHDDSDPSCGIAGSRNAFHCFGCGVSGGIFHAAHFLENKPMTGQAFVTDNLGYLAEKFGVELKHEPLTEEELYELDTYRAYRTAAEYIVSGGRTPQYDQAISDRGWSREFCDQFGIGCIQDYRAFRDSLKSAGFSATFLDDVDLSRRDIFGSDRLIFTIRDHHGRPVGFASRNLSYTEDKLNGAKYVNQKGTGVKCNIYQKSTRLYGLDQLLKVKDSDANQPTYIFEGYPDVATAASNGIWNSVGIGGTHLSPEQIHLLKQNGIYDVVVCLDGDGPGQEKTAEILDKSLAGHKDLVVSVVVIPEEMDPDEFIRAKGVDAFRALKKWTAFEWRLAQFQEDTSTETICKSMIPLIINEPSYVAQEKMCKTLAQSTGVTLRTIQQELERLQNIKEGEKSRGRELILENMANQIRRSPAEAETIIHQAQIELFNIAKNFDGDNLSEESCLADISGQKKYQEEKDGSFSGFVLGPDLYNLQHALAGDWKKDVWFAIGGKPNSGKTSLMSKLCYSIASHEENNACVIVLSIDDSLKDIVPKYVAVAEGSRKITLNQIGDPNYHSKVVQNPKDLQSRREQGYALVSNLVRDGRLILKDTSHGNDIAYMDRLIRYYKTKYPDRNIVFVLDNFHKLRDYKNAKGDDRVRFKEISTVIKDLAVTHHICMISTIEYKKIQHGKKADNSDIIETGQIEYDANIIAHVHNDLHEYKERSKLVHYGDDPENPDRLPIIEMEFGKNKVTDFKESVWFDFFPTCSDFVGVDPQIVANKTADEEDEDSSNEPTRVLPWGK